jgi:hypothetical protein
MVRPSGLSDVDHVLPNTDRVEIAPQFCDELGVAAGLSKHDGCSIARLQLQQQEVIVATHDRHQLDDPPPMYRSTRAVQVAVDACAVRLPDNYARPDLIQFEYIEMPLVVSL